jgi:hypothetical protein
MKQISDIVQMISAILSPMAIVIAGLWAFWRFIIQKEREPRAEFDLTAEFLGLQNGKWVVEISAHLANRGKVRHMMKDATLNVRYLKATDPVVESQVDGHFGQVEFPHSIGRRKIWQDSFIDPGLAFRNSYLTWVPADATYILLLCKFEYERGKWPAQRVLKVPNP